MATKNSYPIPPSDAAELQRLSLQDALLNDFFPLLPPLVTQPPKNVLDVGCGTGGWLRRIAQQYPQSRCVGVDKSVLLLDHGRTIAENDHIDNVDYLSGDFFDLGKILNRQQFDLISMRCSTWFLGEQKKDVFASCAQLLKPGGVFAVTDFEQPYPTTSSAWIRFSDLFTEAMQKRVSYRTGMSELPLMFRSLFSSVEISAFVLDLSAGAPERAPFVTDLKYALGVFKKLVVSSSLLQSNEYDHLKAQCLDDIDSPDFSMIGYAMTIAGQK